MLHVTTEVGQPGKKERERKHFPDIHNRPGFSTFVPHGRKYIPHSYGRAEEWRPHGTCLNVKYSDSGPDWDSRLRYIPHPSNEEYPAAEIWPNNWRSMRPFPFTYMRSRSEWLLDPDHMRVGMKCIFNGQHMATRSSQEEITHSMRFGKGRHEERIDKRNCLPEASPGDKSYQAVEYSPSFHAEGSTRPVINFSAPMSARKPDTFVPLHPVPAVTRENFKQKEKKRNMDEEISVVRKLEEWKPATPLPLTLPQDDRKDK